MNKDIVSMLKSLPYIFIVGLLYIVLALHFIAGYPWKAFLDIRVTWGIP